MSMKWKQFQGAFIFLVFSHCSVSPNEQEPASKLLIIDPWFEPTLQYSVKKTCHCSPKVISPPCYQCGLKQLNHHAPSFPLTTCPSLSSPISHYLVSMRSLSKPNNVISFINKSSFLFLCCISASYPSEGFLTRTLCLHRQSLASIFSLSQFCSFAKGFELTFSTLYCSVCVSFLTHRAVWWKHLKFQVKKMLSIVMSVQLWR